MPTQFETTNPACASPFEGAYQASPARVQSLRGLAAALGALAVYGAAPAVMHLDLAAPVWVWGVLCVAAVQVLLLLWAAATPDFASLRVLMLVFVLVAVGYGAITVLALNASPERPLAWGLDPVRRWVPRWCASVLLFNALGAYLCAYAAHKWRRAFDVEMRLRGLRRG